nr:FkbM family methyltransferase [uncultured Desulfobacter sp.]
MMKQLIKSTVEKFPKIAQLARNIRELQDRGQPARVTPWGFKLAGHEDMANGLFEPEETNTVRSLLAEVDVLVNVGANVGYYCCHALSMGKEVIAVEPMDRNIHYLLQNIKLNGWEEMAEVFPVALGSEASIMNMWGGGTGASLIKGWANIPENYMTQVPVLTLDRILGETLQDRKALILVDVEGAEYMMLKGAKRVLENSPRPIWMIEITSTENQPVRAMQNPHFIETFDIFFELDYGVFTVESKARELTRRDLEKKLQGRWGAEKNYNYVFK